MENERSEAWAIVIDWVDTVARETGNMSLSVAAQVMRTTVRLEGEALARATLLGRGEILAALRRDIRVQAALAAEHGACEPCADGDMANPHDLTAQILARIYRENLPTDGAGTDGQEGG